MTLGQKIGWPIGIVFVGGIIYLAITNFIALLAISMLIYAFATAMKD